MIDSLEESLEEALPPEVSEKLRYNLYLDLPFVRKVLSHILKGYKPDRMLPRARLFAQYVLTMPAEFVFETQKKVIEGIFAESASDEAIRAEDSEAAREVAKLDYWVGDWDDD